MKGFSVSEINDWMDDLNDRAWSRGTYEEERKREKEKKNKHTTKA